MWDAKAGRRIISELFVSKDNVIDCLIGLEDVDEVEIR
jgi:hypothetical protein